jgi:hypothetical protein
MSIAGAALAVKEAEFLLAFPGSPGRVGARGRPHPGGGEEP